MESDLPWEMQQCMPLLVESYLFRHVSVIVVIGVFWGRGGQGADARDPALEYTPIIGLRVWQFVGSGGEGRHAPRRTPTCQVHLGRSMRTTAKPWIFRQGYHGHTPSETGEDRLRGQQPSGN